MISIYITNFCIIMTGHVLTTTALAGRVQTPPLITKQPPTEELLFQVPSRSEEKNKSFILECEAEGEPLPKYSWIKNGKEFNWQMYDDRMSQHPGTGTLVINVPRKEDQGQYQCLAANKCGVATSNSVYVLKSELSSFTEEVFPTIVHAEEGKPFSLMCNAPDGFPKPSVYWVYQNSSGAVMSINSSRITVDPEGTLWFSNVTWTDRSSGFLYACAVYSEFRNEYKLGNRVNLYVIRTSLSTFVKNEHEPVKQYTSPRHAVAILGKSVTLWCIIGGTPLPEIKWARKGSSLPHERIDYENFGKKLKLKNVNFSDETHYGCDASNGVGSPFSYSIQLIVYAVPYFTTEPDIYNAAENETIELKCEASGKPVPEIKWIHNGKPLEAAAYNPRRKKTGNSIVIQNIQTLDTGNYGCNATNSFGYVYKDVYVNVLALPPEITHRPRDVVAIDGNSETLTCRVSGVPKPLVRWLKDAEELTDQRFQVLNSGDLNVQNVSFVDAGKYVCDARNKFGIDSAECTLIVKEHTKILDRPEDLLITAGTTATFQCSAITDATLKLQIDWFKNSEILDFDSEPRIVKLQDNSLTIFKTSESDSGLYTCIARTNYDNVTAEATLIVQDKPNRPHLLGVECRKRDATVRWQFNGDNRSPILYYTIQFNTSFTSDTWENANNYVPANETSYNVTLSPWSNYTFRVIARNQIGSSNPSVSSEFCTTTTEVPFINPENVRGHGTTPDNLVISWTPMQKIDQNAPNFKYQVQWKLEDEQSEWSFKEIHNWRTAEIIIEGVPSYRAYLIRIRAINEVGESLASPVDVIGVSGQAEPTESPSNFTLTEILDSDMVIVEWSPVSSSSLRGKFEGYKILAWTKTESVVSGPGDFTREIRVKNDITSALLDYLIPYTRNYLVVMAYNTDYDGPPSRTIEVDMPEGRPGPIEHSEGYPLGSNAVYLIWEKPKQLNGLILGYRIQYQKVKKVENQPVGWTSDNTNREIIAPKYHLSKVQGMDVGELMDRHRHIANPDELRAKLPGLEPGQKYRVLIRAFTSAGTGPIPKTSIELITDQSNLERPLWDPKFIWNLELTNSDNASIRVRWIPYSETLSRLSEDERPGSHFFVQYKLDREKQYTSTAPEIYEDFIVVNDFLPGETYFLRIVAVGGHMTKTSEVQEIRITGYTRILLPPEDLEVNTGATTVFHCNAVEDSTLTIDWLRNSEKIDFGKETRFKKLVNNSLNIPKTRDTDAGSYTCVARAKNNEDTATATLTVHVNFICQVSGIRKPLQRWLKNNQILTGERFKIMNNYE